MIAINIAIDGGKDSLSMATYVVNEVVISLRQLVIGAYAPCPDITKFVTPDIKRPGNSHIILVDPSKRPGSTWRIGFCPCFQRTDRQ